MKKFSLMLMVFLILSLTNPAAGQGGDVQDNPAAIPGIQAKGAVLVEQQTGKVFYAKNPNLKLYPASTTKILTAMLAIENSGMNEKVTVGKEVNLIKADGSKAGFKPGEQVSMGDLVRGLMLPSGNDAAYTIAVYIGRKAANNQSLSEQDALQRFVDLMNRRAREAGALNSNFVNPHGYQNANHYTTAYDLSMIARQAMQNPFFREVVKTETYPVPIRSGEAPGQGIRMAVWKNRNQLIEKTSAHYFKAATGIKTGHTSDAGYCLVSSASKDGVALIAVVLNSSPAGQWGDSIHLLQYGLANLKYHKVFARGQVVRAITLENAAGRDKLRVLADRDFAGTFRVREIPGITTSIEWDRNLLAPVKGKQDTFRLLKSVSGGRELGKAVISSGFGEIARVGLVAEGDVRVQSIFDYLVRRRYLAAGAMVIILAISAGVFLIRGKRK